MHVVSRRLVQSVLGALWLVDGLLQLKPKMFTQAFLNQVILPTAQGQPHWIAALVQFGGELTAPHIALWNLAFALVQIALGVAFLLNYRVRATIIASLVWAGIVWVFGEGMGQVLSGQALLLNGAPGAVLLYGLAGVAIWPKDDVRPALWQEQGVRFAQWSLALLWTLGFVMHLQPAYLTSDGMSQTIALGWLAKSLHSTGAAVSLVLAVVELGLAILFTVRRNLRFAAAATVVLSLAFWWIGQSFGQVLDPLATDVNSGLLMALLGVCAAPSLFSSPQLHWSRQGKTEVS